MLVLFALLCKRPLDRKAVKQTSQKLETESSLKQWVSNSWGVRTIVDMSHLLRDISGK